MLNTAPAQPAQDTVQSQSWLIVPQRKLGVPGLLTMLIIANTIGPFSLDMYTPSVPSMPAYFNTTATMVNLTLVGFFLFMSLGFLFFGPLSDRYGRRPILMVGVFSFTVGSALCSIAWSIEALIAFRIIEALGAGAIGAVSMAIIKDSFAPERRTQMFSCVQVMMVIGPIAAPLIGGVLLRFGTWHLTFWALAAIGVVCCILALLFEETLEKENRTEGGIIDSFARLGVVARNKGFLVLLFVIAIFNLPFMSYIAAGSYVYIDFFGYSEQEYTYFFSATAALSIVGPVLAFKLLKITTPRKLTYGITIVALLSGVAMYAVGGLSAWVFCACFLVFAMMQSGMRPYCTDILLSQQAHDSGSASALINFVICFFGVIGMVAILLPWPDYATGLGVMMVVCLSLASVAWIFLLKSPSLQVKGLEK